MKLNECPIWGTPGELSLPHAEQEHILVDSERTGGRYAMSPSAHREVKELDAEARARLTTWLVDQRRQGVKAPKVTSQILLQAKDDIRTLEPDERAYRLLRYLASRGRPGTLLPFEDVYQPLTLAITESIEADGSNERFYLLRYLGSKGWIQYEASEGIDIGCIVTIEGYSRIAQQKGSQSSRQAFVAMWFHGSVKEVRENAIVPAIRATGYDPFAVDAAHYHEKIDDKIIYEIPRSRFMVADFTHGPEGARGSVYFEAGLAMGYDIDVIWTCRADQIESLQFDIRQYPFIDWRKNDLDEFQSRLMDRIRALTGERVR